MLPRLWAYVSVSDEDRERTVAYAGATVKNFWVAPNGVDTARIRPRPPGRSSDGKIVLGYLGSLDLSMNADAVRWFCARLLPRIRARLADVDVEFIGIGRNPTHRLRRLASRERGISFSGTVPDVVPWLQSVDILVCPIRMGAGTKLKVAEAMACGLPVIGSPPALAGAPGQDREHFFRAEDDDAFVEAACDLAASPQRRLAVGQAARQMAEERLSWGRIADNLADDIANALSRDGWRA
jgi:glycosyltransferase involved in cell wall biosynthesis